MSEIDDKFDLRDKERSPQGSERSTEEIVDTKHPLVERQHTYRHAADFAAKALIPFKEVQIVAVFGAVAMPLETPPLTPLDRQNETVQGPDMRGVDLAVWLDRFHQLPAMRAAVNRALSLDRGPGGQVAPDDVSIHLMEHGTDRYVGHLCGFRKCPAAKRACEVPGCGAVGHLRQFSDFRFDRSVLQSERCFRLFDRATADVSLAVDLPGPPDPQSDGPA